MPPTGDEHAKLKTEAPNIKCKKERKTRKYNKTLFETQHRLTTPLPSTRPGVIKQ